MDDFAAFGRLLDALRPWLGQLVIVGGWAHRLHRLHESANPPAYQAVRTKDADFAFSLSAPISGDISAALKAADFHEKFFGEHSPPVTHFHLGDEKDGFFAEFLVPLDGGERKRDGKVDATVVRAGVVAQKLRYLQLLLVNPWVVRVAQDVGVPVKSGTDVMVPNPVSFITQKLLIQEKRDSDKKAQDALYIHDTLELFGGDLPALKELWRAKVRPTLPERTAKKVERLQRKYFGSINDVIRNAVRIPQDRVLDPGREQAA
jgi:hypothetical protein